MELIRMRVVRPFMLDRKRQEAGAEVAVPLQLSRELVATGKAERVTPAEPQRGPLTTQTAGVLVAGQPARKGEKDAG